MDFELSDEQGMLQDSVVRFVQDAYEFSNRKSLVGSPLGYSAENWKMFAEMGWLALPFGEEVGGLDGAVVDTNVLLEAMGAGLVLEPYLSTVLLGGKLVEILCVPQQASDILAPVIDGQSNLALGAYEPNGRFDLLHVELSATKSANGYTLSGTKSVVLNAASADKILVTGRTSGDFRDTAGISVFMLDADTKGLTRKDYRLVDGSRASDLIFEDVELGQNALLGADGQAFAAVQSVIDQATVALCAEAVGAMMRVNEITKEYTATRKQFGSAIGDNQVIQHRQVDMFIAAEEAKAITDMAAMRMTEGAENTSQYVAAMKSKVGESARFVGAQGVQLHGGIGMTDEYPIGHYFKRLMAIDVLFGNAEYHLNRFAAAS